MRFPLLAAGRPRAGHCHIDPMLRPEDERDVLGSQGYPPTERRWQEPDWPNGASPLDPHSEQSDCGPAISARAAEPQTVRPLLPERAEPRGATVPVARGAGPRALAMAGWR